MNCFGAANLLLPRAAQMERWAVIACDQFTSQPEYWEKVRRDVGGAPSALDLILPEVELSGDYTARIPAIHARMAAYLEQGFFREEADSFVYVERSLANGEVRRGLVGALDLEDYDYRSDAVSPVRATEQTVVERIPPRRKIREGAPLELPHILLLCDDASFDLIEPLTEEKETLEPLYDFELMEGGGRIRGWLVREEAAARLNARIGAYEGETAARFAPAAPLLYAVGDGNHSLATAKACYEALKERLGVEAARRHPARWALVELENLHDPVQHFAPIHRLVKHCDPAALLRDAESAIGGEGCAIPWCSGEKEGQLRLNTAGGALPVAVLQSFLDDWLSRNAGEIDYIHGDEDLRQLSRAEDALGFLLPAIDKESFFPGIVAGGVLPRKTFSMGQAREKRYYLEARKIR